MQELWSLGGCLVTLLSAGVVGFGIWRAWSPSLRAYVKSLLPLPAAVPIPVPEPVPGTGTPQPEPAASIDINGQLADRELIIILAVQKNDDKTYRFSANAIDSLIGGKRANTLALIKEIRATSPIYYNELIARIESEVKNGA